MVELGVKKIITNPKVMESDEIIRVIDSRSHRLKAFIVPARYEKMIEKLEKEIRYKEWVAKKKELVKRGESFDDLAELGRKSIDEYLG